MRVVHAVYGFHDLFEHGDDVPVVLGRALHVAALPLFPHHGGRLPLGQVEPILTQVVLVPHHHDGHVVLSGVAAALQDLLPKIPDVLEALVVPHVEDEDVRRGVPEPVVAKVGPLVHGVDWEVGDHGTVDDLHLVQVFVDDDGRVVTDLVYRGVILLTEHVTDELLHQRALAHLLSPQHSNLYLLNLRL